MYYKIKEPINISNYYIWNIKHYSKYLSKFWWSWYYNETEKSDIYWTMFNFLVFEEWDDEFCKMWRFIVKINSLKDILFLNRMFTYSNKKFFYSDPKEWIWKMIKTSWYCIWILSVEDLKKFDDEWIELYQANSDLFQSIVNKPIKTIQTNYKKIIFINEYLFSLYYFNTIKKIFANKEIKSWSKIYKFINNDLLIYETFFRKEFSELLESNDITFMNSLALEITDEENVDILNFSYFLKLTWYFSYFDEFWKSLEEDEKKEIYKSIWLINSMFFKDNEEKQIDLHKKILIFMKKFHENNPELLKTFVDKFEEAKEIEMKDVFYNEWEEEKAIKYESNLFKPEYWFQWLTDFLFKE